MTYYHTHDPNVRAAAIHAAVQVATYINHQIDTEEAVLERFAKAYVAILGIIDDPEAALAALGHEAQP